MQQWLKEVERVKIGPKDIELSTNKRNSAMHHQR
jgi:hypothetical protein